MYLYIAPPTPICVRVFKLSRENVISLHLNSAFFPKMADMLNINWCSENGPEIDKKWRQLEVQRVDEKKIMLSQEKRPPLNLVSSSLQKNGVSYDSKKPILVNVVRVNISKSQVDEQKEASLLSEWRNIAPLIFSGSPVYQDTGWGEGDEQGERGN